MGDGMGIAKFVELVEGALPTRSISGKVLAP